MIVDVDVDAVGSRGGQDSAVLEKECDGVDRGMQAMAVGVIVVRYAKGIG